jgi:hypothetical protein
VFNADDAARDIAPATLHLRGRRVVTPAFIVPARSARDIFLGGSSPRFVPTMAAGDPARSMTFSGSTTIALSAGQEYRGPPLAEIPPGAASALVTDFFRDGAPVVILQNSAVRAIVSPDAGARAFVFEDLSTGFNAFTTIGALRDDLASPLPPSPRDYIASYTHPLPAGTFNRPYRCSVLHSTARAMVQCSYDAGDLAAAPVHFEKTFELDAGSRTLSVRLRSSQAAASICAVTDSALLSVRASVAGTTTSEPGFRLLRFDYAANTEARIDFTLQGATPTPANRR